MTKILKSTIAALLIMFAPASQFLLEPAVPAASQTDDPNLRVAYITIDDGPSRNNTPKILDILAEEGIHATFFVLPHEGLDDIYERIIAEGHELANHSYSHNYSKLYKSDDLDAFTEDVTALHNFLLDNFGYTAESFRFPGGSMGRSSAVIDARIEALAELGYSYYDWDVSTGDTDTSPAGKDPDVLTRNVLRNTGRRSRLIVLMHDTSDKTATVKALPGIIRGLRDQGYVFDVVSNRTS